MTTVKFSLITDPVQGTKLSSVKVSGSDLQNAEIIINNHPMTSLVNYVRDTVAPAFVVAYPTNEDCDGVQDTKWYEKYDAVVTMAKRMVRQYVNGRQ